MQEEQDTNTISPTNKNNKNHQTSQLSEQQMLIYQSKGDSYKKIIQSIKSNKNTEIKRRKIFDSLQKDYPEYIHQTPLQQIHNSQNQSAAIINNNILNNENQNNQNINYNSINKPENLQQSATNTNIKSSNFSSKFSSAQNNNLIGSKYGQNNDQNQKQNKFKDKEQIEEYIQQILVVEQVYNSQYNFIQELDNIILEQQKQYQQEFDELVEINRKHQELDTLNNNFSENCYKQLEQIKKEIESDQEKEIQLIKDIEKQILEKNVFQNQNQEHEQKLLSLQQQVDELQNEISQIDLKISESESQINQHKQQAQSIIMHKFKVEDTIDDIIKSKKQLNNELQDIKGNIRVYCRVRPFIQMDGEQTMQQSSINVINESNLIISKNEGRQNRQIMDNQVKDHKFYFEQIFDQSSNQETIFSEIQQLIESFIDGFNVCLFAYGQTGSGKTYTIQGDLNTQNPRQQGILPRSVQFIFEHIESMKQYGWKHNVQISFQEIYMEQQKNLLTQQYIQKSNQDDIWVDIDSYEQFPQLFNLSIINRKTSSTNSNDQSSRSHSICQIRLQGNNQEQKNIDCILSLVDLAGSERLSVSKAEGHQIKETQFINSSLSSLGDVIQAIVEGNAHIPYRNSKLTQFLNPTFTNESKILMFLNLNPCQNSYDQSLQSLRFGDKVGNAIVKCKARKINEQNKLKTQFFYTDNNAIQQQIQQQQQQQQQQNLQINQQYQKFNEQKPQLQMPTQQQPNNILPQKFIQLQQKNNPQLNKKPEFNPKQILEQIQQQKQIKTQEQIQKANNMKNLLNNIDTTQNQYQQIKQIDQQQQEILKKQQEEKQKEQEKSQQQSIQFKNNFKIN